jgi:hypothetical protein
VITTKITLSVCVLYNIRCKLSYVNLSVEFTHSYRASKNIIFVGANTLAGGGNCRVFKEQVDWTCRELPKMSHRRTLWDPSANWRSFIRWLPYEVLSHWLIQKRHSVVLCSVSLWIMWDTLATIRSRTFCLLVGCQKNLKIRIYIQDDNLPVVLYGCET